MKLPLLLISALCLSVSIHAADIPVFFHICPSWNNPRGWSEQYRYCFDRPFAPGDEPDYVWQLRTMKEAVPNSAMSVYCFVSEKRTVDYWCGIFGKYLDAAAQTGTKVFPCIHAINADAAQRPADLARLATALLTRFGDNAAWYRWNGRPLVLDYSCGGIRDPAAFLSTVRAIRQQNQPICYVTEGVDNINWAVSGKFSAATVDAELSEADGVYQFTQPLDGGLGGYKQLHDEIKKSSLDKIYGAGIQNGYYSSRKDMRNFVSPRGTRNLREGFAAAMAAGFDFLHIKTWNDWSEAAAVEPSYAHSHALLDIVSTFACLMNKAPFPGDSQPHLIASYRKNAFPGETLDVEILNLPVTPAFSPLSGKVSLTAADGRVLAEKAFSGLDGASLAATVLSFPLPASLGRDMVQIQVEVGGVQEDKAFHRVYNNLPPVPIVVNSAQADMLEFKVPLHRLNPNAIIRLKVDGEESLSGKPLSAPEPRRLTVDASGGPSVTGVAYLKNGSILNDPDAASREGVVDNGMSDPTLGGYVVGNDYYGALAAFQDGTIAYSNGVWVDEPAAQGVWASYQFEKETRTDRYPAGIPNPLRDISGHRRHGTLAGPPGAKPPQWKTLAPHFDVLRFDGGGGTVSFPVDASLPGPATVEIAFRADALGQAQELWMQRGASLSIRIERDGRISVRRLDQDRVLRTVASPEPITASQWHQVTATYDMKTVRLYVDGEPAGEVEARGLRPSEQVVLGGPVGPGPADTLIDQTTQDGYFKGSIAQLRILDGPLGAKEIALRAHRLLQVLSQLDAGSRP